MCSGGWLPRCRASTLAAYCTSALSLVIIHSSVILEFFSNKSSSDLSRSLCFTKSSLLIVRTENIVYVDGNIIWSIQIVVAVQDQGL